MKNNKGITLTSLVIYIAVIFVVIAALMRITTYFSNNMQDAADVSFETEFQKINLYLLDETKKSENAILEITEDGKQITFEKGNKYTYNEEEKMVYLNNTIKVCEGIENCLFELKTADNGKIVLALTIKINGIEKTVEYVISAGKTLLPDEYQQVEYIESTGTQYIDLGVTFDVDSTRIIGSAAFVNYGTGGGLAISPAILEGGNYFAFTLRNSDSIPTGRFLIGKTFADFSFAPQLKTIYNYEIDKNVAFVDGIQVSEISSSAAFSINMYEFARNTDGTDTIHQYKRLYYLKIYEDEELVRDFIPCYRKSDNVAGLYDVANDIFYINQGTGEFLKGEDKTEIIANKNEDYIVEEDYIIGGNIEENLFESLYQQVEYIESTGTQYIDLGVTFNVDSTRIIGRASFVNYATGGGLAISPAILEGGNYFAFTLRNSDSLPTGRFLIGKTIADFSFAPQLNTIYNYEIDKNVAFVDEIQVSEISSSAAFSINLYEFARNTDGTDTTHQYKRLYYLKIYEDEELVRDFIPCYRKSDNVAGLYDLVNDVFYTNEGEGEFIAGTAIINNEKYQQVKYIESSGTQYIDTGVNGGSSMAFYIKFNNLGKLARNYEQYFAGDRLPNGVKIYAESQIAICSSYGGVGTYINVPNIDHVYEINYKADNKLIVDGVEQGELGDGGWGELTYYVFGSHSELDLMSSMQLYELKMWKDGVLVRDFIPCYRKSDNEAGLYDLVNNAFYTNAGTGVFTLGPNVN